MLISVVGIALLVSTGTDSALAGNYRTSTSAYYAAVAGLEEARGRLLWRNPNFIGYAPPPTGGPPLDVHSVLYILNPADGTVQPTNSGNVYHDTEYDSEFPWHLAGATVQFTPSVSPLPGLGLPGPLYKWVRINPVTETSIIVDVDGQNADDQYTPLFYGGSGLYRPGSGFPSSPPAGNQALEITALAVMPDKSTRILQYVVGPNTLQYLLAPNSFSQGFPAALTLAGNGVTYVGPDSTSFYINGTDPTTGRTCTTPPMSPVSAIGFTNPADQSNVTAGTSNEPGNYTGYVPPPPAAATPSVGVVSLPLTLQKPSQFEALTRSITQMADVVIPGPANRNNMPTTMSPTNPMTVVVNGDLDLSAWHSTGYGLLLVTGNLHYDPDASWEGVILVIGKGTFTGSNAGIGRIDGALLVAQTHDPISGNLLADPNLGASSVVFNSTTGGVGIYYNSCTILQAMAPSSYKVLSFREITQ
jgi:hypothetical protein